MNKPANKYRAVVATHQTALLSPADQNYKLSAAAQHLADRGTDGVTGMEHGVAGVRAVCSQLEDSRVTARREVGER